MRARGYIAVSGRDWAKSPYSSEDVFMRVHNDTDLPGGYGIYIVETNVQVPYYEPEDFTEKDYPGITPDQQREKADTINERTKQMPNLKKGTTFEPIKE